MCKFWTKEDKFITIFQLFINIYEKSKKIIGQAPIQNQLKLSGYIHSSPNACQVLSNR